MRINRSGELPGRGRRGGARCETRCGRGVEGYRGILHSLNTVALCWDRICDQRHTLPCLIFAESRIPTDPSFSVSVCVRSFGTPPPPSLRPRHRPFKFPHIRLSQTDRRYIVISDASAQQVTQLVASLRAHPPRLYNFFFYALCKSQSLPTAFAISFSPNRPLIIFQLFCAVFVKEK